MKSAVQRTNFPMMTAGVRQRGGYVSYVTHAESLKIARSNM